MKFYQTLTEVPTQKGKVLMTENQVNKDFYIILDGQFEILKQVWKPVSNEDLSDTQIKDELKLIKKVLGDSGERDEQHFRTSFEGTFTPEQQERKSKEAEVLRRQSGIKNRLRKGRDPQTFGKSQVVQQ